MNTPSHFLMTATLEKILTRAPIHRQAFLLGSVAPDIPLWILSLGGIAYYHFILGWSLRETSQWMFTNLYFQNPFWLAFHNLLHAPLLLFLGIFLVWRKRNSSHSLDRWLFWFLTACSLHAFVDIFTHADDGPLLFFPLNWTVRFNSAISYWDPRYHGWMFSRFELGLDCLFVFYLLKTHLRQFFHRLKQT